jgi:3alpha(or 20beta)-hydroxysteroid dehydrogenase
MSDHLLRFDRRVAVVTGGASGMGKEICRRLGEGGAQVVVVDINESAANQVARELPNAIAVRADVTNEADTRAYAQAAVNKFGRIDLFSNNAGILGKPGPLVEASAADFDSVFGVNVRGAFFGLREVLRHMLAQGHGGAIVTTASIAGLRGVAGCSLYSASKFAVLGLTRSVAKEYGARGIRANAICPAATETAFSVMTEATRASQAANIPLGRVATADDMARAVAWLLSDAAAFVNGAVLPVDGGQTA